MSAKKTPAKKTAAKKTPAVATVDKTPETPVTEPTVDEVLAAQKPTEPQEEIKAASPAAEPETPLDIIVKDVASKVSNADKKVIFVAKDKEYKVTIQAGGVSYAPSLDETKSFIVWKVDPKNADLFSQHSFVRFGKIVRALGK